jgi:hypothetical protein
LLDKEDTQVVDFHFPGDTVGLEAIDSGTYTYTARALSETLVCRVDVDNPLLALIALWPAFSGDDLAAPRMIDNCWVRLCPAPDFVRTRTKLEPI